MYSVNDAVFKRFSILKAAIIVREWNYNNYSITRFHVAVIVVKLPSRVEMGSRFKLSTMNAIFREKTDIIWYYKMQIEYLDPTKILVSLF